jgi:hypothetical protein
VIVERRLARTALVAVTAWRHVCSLAVQRAQRQSEVGALNTTGVGWVRSGDAMLGRREHS